MTEDIRIDDAYAKLDHWLRCRVRDWQLPPAVDAEDIVAESVGRLWMKEAMQKTTVVKAENWLSRTAKNIVREYTRKAARFQVSEADEQESPEHADPALSPETGEALRCSQLWRRLTVNQQHVIEQCVMLGRPYADVARDLGMKRQTVAGWAKRIPPRLATDPAFESLCRSKEATSG